MIDAQAMADHCLTEVLVTTPAAIYASEVQVGQSRRTLARRVLFYFFHEAGHAGELSILRQLTGIDDNVI